MRGFTFIEFAIMAAILGILAAIAIPNLLAYREKKMAEKPAEDPRTEEQKVQDDWEVKKTFTLEGCQGYRFHIRAVGDKFIFVCPPGGNKIEVVP